MAGTGIFARNDTAGASLTIDAAAAEGGTYCIEAHNQGSGALSVTTTGTVTGTALDGIFANNSAHSGDGLMIETADVTGGRFGIRAKQYGAGALSITASGTVTGTNRVGILVQTYGTSLTITAADVAGGNDGIRAKQYGAGALSITASGTVTGLGL